MKKIYKMLLHKTLMFILLFYNLNCINANFDAIINLGGDCQVTHQLKIHGLRKYALPFDWLITSYAALAAILQNNFEGFIEPDNFELSQDQTFIFDKRYNTRWIHDFKLQDDFLKDYNDVAQKYQRRIERLQQLIATSKNPLFIRKRITKQQAIELWDLLFVIRQGQPFWLVVLDGSDEIKDNWHLENIYNYYLRQLEPYSWKGDSQAWKEIFQNLGLELSDQQESIHEY